jgi:hypothetical protein
MHSQASVIKVIEMYDLQAHVKDVHMSCAVARSWLLEGN